MKLSRRIISILLVIFMLMPTLAESVSGLGIESLISGSVYKIANDYVRFSYDAETGAFSIETKEGHPQKSFDNNIPLLYNEAAARSNGTSYTTVRIDGKDYIFGQDYGYFGIETDIYTPVISNGGRMMSVSWGVKGYLITQNVIISEIEDSDLAGNVGIGYTVVNMNDTDGTVGIRLLLDNALDSKVDAPYVINGEIFSPTIVETEYSDAMGNMPDQLTFVDSLANTKKMAYAMLKGWSGESDTTPDKVIVGHWANLANTRYDYVPDESCDFSNYSNVHRVPDTATAVYWTEEKVAAKSSRTMEMLYGIGNFTADLSDEHIGLSINVPSVKLNSAGTAYANGGEIELIVTVDNSVDSAVDIITAQVDIFLENGLVFKDSGSASASFTYGEILGEQILEMGIPKGTVKTIKRTVVVSPEANLTSKNITVNVSATEFVTAEEWVQSTYSTQKNVLVPGVDGILPDVKMTSVSPRMVYTEGEKNITVSGDMESLRALKASTGWELYLVKGLQKIRIDKSTIAFPNDTYKTMTFSTEADLAVGDYKIVFHFTDKQLKDELTSKITAAEVLTVCDDSNFRAQSYGLVAMVRFEVDNLPAYDFVSFISEEQLALFENGEIPGRGLKYDVINFDDSCEVMAVVRGKIRVMKEGDKVFYQANTTDGDITINNLLVYSGSEPLTMSIEGDWFSTQNDNIAKIAGNGLIKVIGSIDVWRNGWSLEGKYGEMHTLGGDGDEAFVLKLGIGGSIIQYIGGLLIDLKYGELTRDGDLYGISFGGKVTIPIKAKKKDAAQADPNDPNANPNDPDPNDPNAKPNDPDPNDPNAKPNDPDPNDPNTKPNDPDPNDPNTKPNDPDPNDPNTKPNDPDPNPGNNGGNNDPDPDPNPGNNSGNKDPDPDPNPGNNGGNNDPDPDPNPGNNSGNNDPDPDPNTGNNSGNKDPDPDPNTGNNSGNKDPDPDPNPGNNGGNNDPDPNPGNNGGNNDPDPNPGNNSGNKDPDPDPNPGNNSGNKDPDPDPNPGTNTPTSRAGADNTQNNNNTNNNNTNNNNNNNSGSGSSGNKVGFTKPSGDNPPQLTVTNSDSKLGKYVNSLGKVEDEPDDGEITAEIEDIIFGHKSYNEETGEYETGFVGINTSLEVKLPADVLGGLFKNKVGVEAKVTINTIEKAFGIDFGVEVKDAFECEITLEFKQLTRKKVEKYLPDTIKLYIGGDFMKIPFFGIPATFVTGIGGGVSNLADSLKDKEEGEQVSPFVINVRLDITFAELLKGKFEGEFSAEHVSITGEMTLKNDDDGKVLKVEAGVNVRWKPEVNINIYGNASLLQGLMKGGMSITIKKDYFYAYYYATLQIPESVFLIGGKELGGVEAAGGVDFIGANLKIIGIKFGFIYYWGGDFHIGQGIDLSGRGDAIKAIDTSYYDEDGNYVQCTALYGTNLRRLTSTRVDSGRAGGILIKKMFDPSAEDALLLEVPFDGVKLPTAGEIILITPSGRQIEMIPDDGQGGGNFLINDRGENAQKYIYITITDDELLEAGEWTLSVTTDGVTVSDFVVNGVDDLPDIADVNYSYSAADPYKLTVNYDIDGESDVPGALDVYITDNPNAMSDLRQSTADPNTGLISLGRVTLDNMRDGSAVVEIPDTLTGGEYYVLCMLSQDIGGMSMTMSEDTFTFVNDKLPENVDDISVTYGGDGDLRIEIERENAVDYNAYVIRILDENMELVADAIFEQEISGKIYNSELGAYENEVYYFGEHQGLTAGNTYYVAIDTVRYEDDKRYYSNDTVYSEAFVMPEKKTPVLLSVESNVDPDASAQGIDTFEATYTFDRDVYFFIVADTLTKSYSTECKKVHTVSIPLIEGDHVIDFYAVTPEYDTTDSTVHEEASFAFIVDNTPPLLKVGQAISQNIENPDDYTAVSMQNVLVGDDGMLELAGVTDPDAVLTLDGTTEGITLNKDGAFTVSRRITAERGKSELELVAQDKAGNKTTILVHLVVPSLSNFNAVELKADKQTAIVDDVKKITIPVGTTVNLSAFGIYGEDKTALEGDDISWKILYEQNIIGFNEGVLTALVPGETAISVIYEIATFELDGKVVKSTLTDVIVIEVTERKVSVDAGADGAEVSVETVRTDYASYSKIALIIDKDDISSVVANVDGKETVFYYVGDNTYIASFATDVDEEDVIGGLKIVQSAGENDNPEALLKGDYNGDGSISAADMNLVVDTFHGDNENNLGDDAFIRGDVNGDGIINVIDAQLILISRIKK